MKIVGTPAIPVVGGAVMAMFVVGLAVVAGATDDQVDNASVASPAVADLPCAVTGSVRGLTPEQARNASVIVSTTFANSAENVSAAQIALMVAYTESGLRNLGPRSGNADSLGLFQQRASQGWGTPAEELDPGAATAMFARRLLALPGWVSLEPWVAAQAVQRSAFPDGSNYQRNWSLAGGILAEVLASGSTPAVCGGAE